MVVAMHRYNETQLIIIIVPAKTTPSTILFHDDWNSPLIGVDETPSSDDESPYRLDNIVSGVKSYLCGDKCFGDNYKYNTANYFPS